MNFFHSRCLQSLHGMLPTYRLSLITIILKTLSSKRKKKTFLVYYLRVPSLIHQISSDLKAFDLYPSSCYLQRETPSHPSPPRSYIIPERDALSALSSASVPS